MGKRTRLELLKIHQAELQILIERLAERCENPNATVKVEDFLSLNLLPREVGRVIQEYDKAQKLDAKASATPMYDAVYIASTRIEREIAELPSEEANENNPPVPPLVAPQESVKLLTPEMVAQKLFNRPNGVS